jgi:multicomponent Na+:H+ antiporter subunit D
VRGFFAAPATPSNGVREAPLPSLLAIAVTAGGCIALFFWAAPLYRLVGEVLP